MDERTNTLLVTDTRDKIIQIQELVTELDYAVRQVQIESRIVIASSDFAHELGVRFGVSYHHGDVNSNTIGSQKSSMPIILSSKCRQTY